MITGLHYDFTTDEIKTHLAKRIKHHKDKAKLYKDKASKLKKATHGVMVEAMGEGKMSMGQENPAQRLENRGKNHKADATRLKILYEHLVPDETYRLSESEMAKLELLTEYF